MSFLKRLFNNSKLPSVDENGHINAGKIIELIDKRAANFRGGQGMVLVIQLSWRVQLHFVDGIPICSWQFSNNQLCFNRLGALFSEGPFTFELQKGSFKKFQRELKSYYRKQDLKVTPLSKYEEEQWCLRISFGDTYQFQSKSFTGEQ